MRKPDDDLKISISDIFGGDVTPLDSKSGELSASEAGSGSAEPDSDYQAFIDERKKLLEVKTAEIESVLPPGTASIGIEATSAQQEPVYEAAPEPVAEPAPEAPPTEDVIDFNAPMRPPFMGTTQPEEQKAASEDETEKASLFQKGISFFLFLTNTGPF